ncbi:MULTISPECIES: diguanylate cyclase domain-containing protein [unclassified Pseudomonas]|uniref:diguanylate cyclase domain-containing protein n=1 Tax=unclassified Pseudomonas TaxID=196821 RepID=UPI0021C59A32|nr:MULTISPECIES: diguanylate cyclase [unclassified Pseudomonas]MCU1732933.1 diguanylate cyclase [Pseudomonas sp. 20P_3.2_Bac4]MCU1742401.1 diguanylate cyclase [Pseudomonas sp. 20P_3.2_Bac5]
MIYRSEITIVDAEGHVLAAWPPSLLRDGQALTSSGAEHALNSRVPLISDAYTSSAGNLVVFISHPVFDAQKRYLGVVGGAVHLREKGILHTLISNHFTVSLGVARCAGGGDFAEALKRADDLMYQAKQAGRNRVLSEPL